MCFYVECRSRFLVELVQEHERQHEERHEKHLKNKQEAMEKAQVTYTECVAHKLWTKLQDHASLMPDE